MVELNFADLLDADHELLRAAKLIDWDQLHESLRSYSSTLGRHGKPIRLMVGLQLLKHYCDCSDERVVEQLHENAYWQCFCGFEHFQRGQIIEPTTLVKFRDRIGVDGMRIIEAALLNDWHRKGLVKTRRVAVDTTCQPKNIAYPTDADLLYRIRERIVKQVKQIRQTVGLRKPFSSFARSSTRVLMKAKKLYRQKPDKQRQAIGELLSMTSRVVRQGARISNSLYARGHKKAAGKLNRLVSVGRQIVTQSRQVLKGQKPKKRLYSLHEYKVAVIKKGKKPQRDSDQPWFKQALKQRVKIEPVIGHLKADHRMGRCRYKGPRGDTSNVIWAAAAWNMRKVTRIQAKKKTMAEKRKLKRAA